MIWLILIVAVILYLLFEKNYIMKIKIYLSDNMLWIIVLAFIFVLEMYWAFTLN
jgi:hypothetical protein